MITSVLVMMLSRMGSFNTLEQTKSRSFWKQQNKDGLPSADVIGTVVSKVDVAALRAEIRNVIQPPEAK